MIVLLFFVCGLAIGGGLSIAWWSVDVLLGTHTITGDKAAAMVGLSTVGAALWIGGLMLSDEFRRPRGGYQPRHSGRPGAPPNKGSGAR